MSFLPSLGIVHFGLFCAAVMLLNVTPGPDTAFIVGQSVAHGRKMGVLSALGISAGCLVHTAALALGLSALLAASSGAFLVIKVVGAIYLCLLGARMIVATLRSDRVPPHVASRVEARPSSRRAFVRGLLTNVSNPKVLLFFLSFFPQFVDAASPSKAVAFVVLGLVLVVMSTLYNAAVAWLASGLTRRMRAVPRLRAWLERSIGAAFMALGVRIAFVEH